MHCYAALRYVRILINSCKDKYPIFKQEFKAAKKLANYKHGFIIFLYTTQNQQLKILPIAFSE